MKKLLVVLAVISLTGSVASAQKVRSDNQDIRFTAGVRIPIEHSRANSGEVMSLTYGKYNDKGFGFHGGVQWMFENMDINDYLGLPLSVSWSSGRRTFKQTLEDGLENTLRNAYHNKYYYNQNPTVDNVVGSFFTGLFNRIEFFAGLTPGYIFGPMMIPLDTAHTAESKEKAICTSRTASASPPTPALDCHSTSGASN